MIQVPRLSSNGAATLKRKGIVELGHQAVDLRPMHHHLLQRLILALIGYVFAIEDLMIKIHTKKYC